jgi:hypothetical protein
MSRLRIGRQHRYSMRRPAALAVALLFAVAATASAAAAGDPLRLGVLNTINVVTRLSGATTTAMLRLINTGGGSALDLRVNSGVAPMTVNSTTTVANLSADSVDGVDSAQLQRVLTSGCAGSAVLHDINPNGTPSCVLPDGGNAQWLDGIDSADFMQGRGSVVKGARALPPDGTLAYVVLQTSNPSFRVAYNCPANLAAAGVVVFINDNGEDVNAFWDNGTADPEYQQLAANGGRHDVFASAKGEHYTIQVQGSQITTFEIFSVHRASDCHIQAQAVISR